MYIYIYVCALFVLRVEVYSEIREVQEEQQAGDVYLSSSALMLHAPKFSYASYSTRVIAIHARILYDSPEIAFFYANKTADSWRALTNILANNLASADIAVPSLNQILFFQHQMR